MLTWSHQATGELPYYHYKKSWTSSSLK